MRELDLIEQEELSKLKSIWQEYGLAFIAAVVVFIAVYGGTIYWNRYQKEQASKAAYLFETYLENIANKENDSSAKLVAQLSTEYKSTPYASLANLQQAKELYLEDKNKNLDAAIDNIKWVIKNGNDTIFRDSARLQLMQLLQDKKDYAQIVSVANSHESSAMANGILELKGDALAQQKKFSDAKAAYQQALTFDSNLSKKMGRQPKVNPIVSMKIESLPN